MLGWLAILRIVHGTKPDYICWNGTNGREKCRSVLFDPTGPIGKNIRLLVHLVLFVSPSSVLWSAAPAQVKTGSNPALP